MLGTDRVWQRGAARSAQLNYPEAVALDPSGSLYIADTYDAELRWVSAAATASFTAPTGRVVLTAFSASVTSKAVTVRYALSASAAVTLSVASAHLSAVVARTAGSAGFGLLAWNRKLGSSTAPRGRYTLTVTASAGGRSASSALSVRLG